MSLIFEDEEQKVLKVPVEIWNLIMAYYFWIDPRPHADFALYVFRASFPVLKGVFTLTSKTFHQLVQKWTKNMTPDTKSLGKGSVATFCSSNGYTSLLKYAIERNAAITTLAITEAARLGHLECFKVLEELGCTPGTKSQALNEAARNGRINVVKYLTDQGLVPTELTFRKAISSGSIELVKFLQRWKIVDNYKGLGFLAVESGKFEMIKFIEQYTPCILDQSCVAASARSGSIEMLQHLLDKGFLWDPSVCELAYDNGHKEYLKFAIHHGAPIGGLLRRISQKNDMSMLKELHGIRVPWDGRCLEAAAQNGQLELLKFMIENCEDVLAHQRAGDLNEALKYAVQLARIDCIKYLLEHGAQRDDIIDEALHMNAVQYLHEQGCSWSSKTTYRAALRTDIGMLRYLHDNGCPWDPHAIMDVTIENMNSWQSNKIENLHAVEYLHEQGCTWTERTSELAAENGLLSILRYMHEHGCPWDERTCTAAALMKETECLTYLLDNGCPCGNETMDQAVLHCSLQTVQWLHERGVPWTSNTCHNLIDRGNLDLLKYAHENGAQWSPITITAYTYCSLDCLEYALEQGCPWDRKASRKAAQTCEDEDEVLELYRRLCAKK